MKRLITVVMTMLIVLSLAGCGSSGSSENGGTTKKSFIGETEFLSPDEVTKEKSKGQEKGDSANSGGYDYTVIFSYDNFETAFKAYEAYAAYLKKEFPNLKDSKGYIIGYSNPSLNESSTFTIGIRQGVVLNDTKKKEIAGKYLMTEYGDYTDQLKKWWEDKSFYTYIEITGEEVYLKNFNGKETTINEEYTLEAFIDGSTVKYENGVITISDSDGTMVFTKNNEIPD